MRKPLRNQAAISPYITPEGQKQLSAELAYLWKTKRPVVTRAVADAAAMGDRSENAEYIYGKKQLREIDARMRFLRKRLDALIVVDRTPEDKSKIFFGAWIEIENDEGEVCKYRIVGSDEIDPGKNFISIDSPMAKALLSRSEGDEVIVSTPGGTSAFVVISISY